MINKKIPPKPISYEEEHKDDLLDWDGSKAKIISIAALVVIGIVAIILVLL